MNQQPVPESSPGPVVPGYPLPQDRTIVRQPDHEALATVRPEPSAEPRIPTPRPESAPRRHRARIPAAAPARSGAEPAPAARTAPRPHPAASLPGGAGVCALGESYGGWAKDSDASRICHESYGR
ncbi:MULTISPECIES: hypothetical protein [unclassified Streptomyces]|uniref:hypothetical protein n=1 Tax=unclassified Streptomyces TaxID=2593676 RepID=UPI0024BB9BD9|nr:MULTISPECIES: hypothetical protein [unclassified Streptomyces]MDJ0343058.1 hypothetical protein [Streptomyces sp. PH10-H1]